MPSVRCSRRSSSDSVCFSIDLFLRKPLRPRSTPADWMARIRSSLFWRLKYGISRCLPAKMNTCHCGGEIKTNDSTDIAWDGGASYQDNSIGKMHKVQERRCATPYSFENRDWLPLYLRKASHG